MLIEYLHCINDRYHQLSAPHLAALAQRCEREGLGRLDWAVLDWNASAIGFYDRIGAQALDDWRLRRLSGDALAALAR